MFGGALFGHANRHITARTRDHASRIIYGKLPSKLTFFLTHSTNNIIYYNQNTPNLHVTIHTKYSHTS